MAKKSSYWQDREEQERRWQMKQLADDERYIGQIRSQYEAAIRRINDDINNQLQWLATRSGQPYAEMQKEVDNLDIQRASQDAQKLVGRANQLRGQGHRVTYGDFTSEENARMRLYNATMRINRLEFLKSEVGIELTQLTGELNASLGLKLTDDARKEFKRQAGIMGEQLGNAKPWTSFQPQVLVMKNVQGGNWSQRLWKNQDVLKANLDAVLSAGFISGESNQKMAQRLRKAVRSTMENQRYVTERLVRTESARVAYDVQRESIEANGFKWVEWFAEPSACTVCARLARVDNGEGPGIYPLKKVPKIPQDTHPNCRCSIGSYYSDKMLDKKLNELGFGKKPKKSIVSNEPVNLANTSSKRFKELMDKPLKELDADDVTFLGDAFNNENDIRALLGNKDAITEAISKYRPVGGTVAKDRWMPRSSVPIKKALNEAFDHYPSDWVGYLNKNEYMYAGKNQRGFYVRAYVDGNGRYKIPESVRSTADIPKYMAETEAGKYNTIFSSGRATTAWHELGHFVETHNPEVERIEREFLKRRTEGEKPERLYDIFNGHIRYRLSEITKKDNFINPYIGKEYQKGTEVLSIGLESLFEPGEGQLKEITKAGDSKYVKIKDDKEYMNLVLGLLLKG